MKARQDAYKEYLDSLFLVIAALVHFSQHWKPQKSNHANPIRNTLPILVSR